MTKKLHEESKTTALNIDNLISFDQLVEKGIFKKGTLYFYTSNHLIPFFKIGRRIMFDRVELQEWIESKRETGSL